MKSYCVTCRREEEMVVVDVSINNKHEKRISGYCKVCCEKMCLIIYVDS